MKNIVKIVIAFCLISSFMYYDHNAVAQELKTPYEPLSLFDGRLRITGMFDHIAKLRIHTPKELRWSRKSALNMFRSNFSLETNYFMVRQSDLELNLIGHFYFSYEWMFHLDKEYDRAFPTYGAHKFRHTKDEDIIRELYLQFIKGSWDIRIGKQQVIWGEQLGIRTLDVVNPLDIRTEAIGLTEWENIRIGLWMLRAIYDFADSLPGQLSLEGIFIPFDYQPTEIPREGSFFIPPFHPDGIPRNGYLTNLIDYRYYHDAKDHHHQGLKNAEWGVRLRGYYTGWDLDWSLVYFHTLDDGGVWADHGEGGHISAQYFTLYNLGRKTDEPPRRRVFDFKPYNIFGCSFQRYFGGLLDAVVRLEFVFESNRHYNKYEDDKRDSQGRILRDVVEKDSISYGLNFSKKLPWPTWTPYLYKWSGGKYIDFDISVNQLHWIDYDRDFGEGDSTKAGYRLNGEPHGRGDNPVTALSWMIMTHFKDDNIIPIMRGTYWLNSPSLQFSCSISYRPGEHWAYSVGTSQYMSKRSTDPYSGSEQRDDVYFKISYMF
jgi:hypothetical protein